MKLKTILKETIKENGFEGGIGGYGSMNYGNSYGTPSGGNTTQDPSKFSSSDKTVSHFAQDTTGSAVPVMPDRPDRITKSVMSPVASAEKLKSEKPLNPEHEYDTQVDQLFSKKHTPSPDEIMAGMQYELGRMVKKDKAIAKQEVLKNLKSDPQFYSRLDMLNIDDDKMKVTENKETTVSKTKAVLDEMIAARQKNRPIANAVAESSEINQIFKDLTDKRRAIPKIKL